MSLSERDEMVVEYPYFASIADPLLVFIYENGGEKYEIKAKNAYEPLANYFQLTETQKTRTENDIYDNGRNGIYWKSLVQRAKESLLLSHIMPGPKGIWSLTKSGIEKAKSIVDASDILIYPIDMERNLLEGSIKTVTVNKYERSKHARDICVKKYGYNCQVCNICFVDIYGPIGKDFIHIHHITPLHEVGSEYQIDPINDLIPLCPNCHSMIHKRTPPYSIEELKNIIKKSNKAVQGD